MRYSRQVRGSEGAGSGAGSEGGGEHARSARRARAARYITSSIGRAGIE